MILGNKVKCLEVHLVLLALMTFLMIIASSAQKADSRGGQIIPLALNAFRNFRFLS